MPLKLYLQNETQQQARARLTKIFRVKFGKGPDLDFIFSHRIRLAMFRISYLTENIFSDRLACHLFLELLLLFHATNKYEEQHTINWIMKYYPGKLDAQQIIAIHKLVLRYSTRQVGCFCC